MLDQFPKQRIHLPQEYEDIYAAHILENREGQTQASSITRRMEMWMHKQIAKNMNNAVKIRSTLEIGAGTLNQIPFEPEAGPYDIVEPSEMLYKNSPYIGRIRNIYADISEVPSTLRYDRVTSIATFEHICDLPYVIAKAGLLLRPDGCLRVAIPSEGTLLWTLGWKLTTGVEFRLRHGLDYGLLMKYEHVNTARDIESLLNYFFDKVSYKVLGISKSLSFYQFFNCTTPKIEQCTTVVSRTY